MTRDMAAHEPCRTEREEDMTNLITRRTFVGGAAGAAGIAALLSGRLPVARRRVAVIASGGNVDLSRLRDLLT